jgi:hypothetical protein
MSGVSHFVPKPLPPTGHDWSIHGNPPPNNYFKSKEVNMNEFDYDYDYNSYNYADYEQDYCYPPDQYAYYENSDYTYYDSSYPNQELQLTERIDQEDAPNENFQKGCPSEKPR